MKALALTACTVMALASAAHAQDEPASEGPDEVCLERLRETGAPFRNVAPDAFPGVQTPVEITGPLAGFRLAPRGRRAPVMDCTLATAPMDAAPILTLAGCTELGYSGAYDHRTRRGSTQLSAHAHGLAIDVHTLRGPGTYYDVARHFESGV